MRAALSPMAQRAASQLWRGQEAAKGVQGETARRVRAAFDRFSDDATRASMATDAITGRGMGLRDILVFLLFHGKGRGDVELSGHHR